MTDIKTLKKKIEASKKDEIEEKCIREGQGRPKTGGQIEKMNAEEIHQD